MSAHDWTRVDAGIFHAFHLGWLSRLQGALNAGIMPEGYYALAEQHAGKMIPDVLTLHSRPESTPAPELPASGGTLVAEAPPQVRRKQSLDPTMRGRRRSLAIRHVSGHRLVAILEVLSPSNKDRLHSVQEFVGKVATALDYGVHLLVIDLFPQSRFDPDGIHGAIFRS